MCLWYFRHYLWADHHHCTRGWTGIKMMPPKPFFMNWCSLVSTSSFASTAHSLLYAKTLFSHLIVLILHLYLNDSCYAHISMVLVIRITIPLEGRNICRVPKWKLQGICTTKYILDALSVDTNMEQIFILIILHLHMSAHGAIMCQNLKKSKDSTHVDR